jgi:uncharacterized protein YwgA
MVNKNKLWKYLEEISDTNIQTFEDSKKLQKIVYFLQRIGLDMGYRFGWYIHGPYSSDLTKDAFELYNQKETLKETEFSELDQTEIDVIERVKKFLGDLRDSANMLELLASLDFIKNIAYIPNVKDKNKQIVIDQLKKLEPKKFSDDDIEMSWDRLHRNCLV